jgi:hypothetical protein
MGKQRNAADESQVAEAAGSERRGRDRELNDLRVVMSSPEGRRFIWRWLGMCGVFRTSFETNARIYFNEGQRDIGLRLTAEITEADEALYLQMQREAFEQAKRGD